MAVIMTSAAELRRFFFQTKKAVTDDLVVSVQKKMTLQLLVGVVKKTPVDKGRARGNWQVGIGFAPGGLVGGSFPKNVSGSPESVSEGNVLSKGIATILGAKVPYQIWYVTNNVPYIVFLDQGGFKPPDPGPSRDRRKFRKGRILVKGGFSVQSPNSMVDATIEEIRSQLV